MVEFIAYWLAAPLSAVIHNCNLWEWPLACLLLFGALRGWLPVPSVWVRRAYRWSRSPWIAYCSLPLVLLAVRALLLPWKPVPLPYVPDEWSHRLLADTLLAGRFANPPHPLWPFFETIHVLPLPSYASMYLPGPALILAAGQFLFGSHFAGVLLGCVLMTVASLWALRAWLPPFWAWWGTALIAGKVLLNGSANGYWINSYWGGAPGALGGAMVLGAAGRIRSRPSVWLGLIYGAGLVLLGMTRPLEGAVMGAAVTLWLLARDGRRLFRPALGATITLALGALFLTQFCRAVTGDPWQLPYFANQQRYGWPMTALWMTPVAKPLNHAKLADYWDWERSEHRQIETAGALLQHAPLKFTKQWHHYAGPLLSIPLLGIVAALRVRRVRWLGFLAALGLVVVATEQSAFPHYFAPFTVALIAVFAWAGRTWVQLQPRVAIPYLVWLPAALLVALIPRTAAPFIERPEQIQGSDGWCCRYGIGEVRQRVVTQLSRLGTRHVVLVRYSRRDPNFTLDWVYNPPVIDSASVIFARDRGEPQNQALRDYYPDRTFWVAIPDQDPIVVEPYNRLSFQHGNFTPLLP